MRCGGGKIYQSRTRARAAKLTPSIQIEKVPIIVRAFFRATGDARGVDKWRGRTWKKIKPETNGAPCASVAENVRAL